MLNKRKKKQQRNQISWIDSSFFHFLLRFARVKLFRKETEKEKLSSKILYCTSIYFPMFDYFTFANCVYFFVPLHWTWQKNEEFFNKKKFTQAGRAKETWARRRWSLQWVFASYGNVLFLRHLCDCGTCDRLSSLAESIRSWRICWKISASKDEVARLLRWTLKTLFCCSILQIHATTVMVSHINLMDECYRSGRCNASNCFEVG